jgi:ribonuclease D
MSPNQEFFPDLISDPQDLKRLVERLSREPVISVDTESNSLYAYQEQVCLIQFSAAGKDFLVDPLALEDLSPLGKIFADEKIEKVFHAAEYDIICLHRDFDFEFANLFDTMWAARVSGREAIGLSSLLEEEFGVKADKRYQRADWGKRPLSDAMLAYARLDTHYLITLRNRLRAELVEKGRLELAQEDFVRMERLYERATLNGNAPACWERISGTRDLDPQQMAILKALCEYREQVASQRNRPVFKVLGDATLVKIASTCPVSLDELESLDHISTRQVRQYGEALLAAVREGLNAPPIKPKPGPRPDPAALNRMDAVRMWRKLEAKKLGVESDVVLPRDLMVEVVEHNPRSLEALQGLLAEVPYRQEHWGRGLLEAVRRG